MLIYALSDTVNSAL